MAGDLGELGPHLIERIRSDRRSHTLREHTGGAAQGTAAGDLERVVVGRKTGALLSEVEVEARRWQLGQVHRSAVVTRPKFTRFQVRQQLEPRRLSLADNHCIHMGRDQVGHHRREDPARDHPFAHSTEVGGQLKGSGRGRGEERERDQIGVGLKGGALDPIVPELQRDVTRRHRGDRGDPEGRRTEVLVHRDVAAQLRVRVSVSLEAGIDEEDLHEGTPRPTLVPSTPSTTSMATNSSWVRSTCPRAHA